ncbi:MAG: hypothetical protein QOF02_2067 [Blastocatellia bacterium]|nr:hypothetical protein [Blastocatellia bacterium]
MKHSHGTAAIVLALSLLFLCQTRDAQAQRKPAREASPVITAARVDTSGGSFHGPLYVTIGGAERKIADEAIAAWIIQGGRQVVYSGRDGAGGFENEGQSLRSYDARTGKRRKLMAEYVGITKVEEATTSGNGTALLLEMADGGLGASYVAVVDPRRGELFFRRWAKIISRQGDIIVIGYYREADWDKLNEDANARLKPYKRERHNLNTILSSGRVIFNKPMR